METDEHEQRYHINQRAAAVHAMAYAQVKYEQNRMDMTSGDKNKHSSLVELAHNKLLVLTDHISINGMFFSYTHSLSYLLLYISSFLRQYLFLFCFLMTPVCRLATRCSHSFPALFHFHCHNTISR